MSSSKMDLSQLDNIVKKTVDAVNDSKVEIYQIAESARKECKRLEEEHVSLKGKAKDIIESVKRLEIDVAESRSRLVYVSKNFNKYSQDDIKNAYEKADNLRVELALKRQEEQHIIQRRNDIELSLRESAKTVEKAETLINSLGISLGYLSGDLLSMSSQIEDVQHRQQIGIRIIKAQEEERQRVAREIHDGPAQSMSNVVLKAEICERLMNVDMDKTKEEIKKLKQVVRDSLQDVRRIIYNLRPMSLDDLGLIPTLQKYVSTFECETGIASQFKTIGNIVDVKSIISLTIFRITQESMNNAKKHGKSKSVNVCIEFTKTKINLYIADEGKGFDMEEVKNRKYNINGGFGLFSMKERLELLDGEFEITSSLGVGTKVNVNIPLMEEGMEDEKN